MCDRRVDRHELVQAQGSQSLGAERVAGGCDEGGEARADSHDMGDANGRAAPRHAQKDHGYALEHKGQGRKRRHPPGQAGPE